MAINALKDVDSGVNIISSGYSDEAIMADCAGYGLRE